MSDNNNEGAPEFKFDSFDSFKNSITTDSKQAARVLDVLKGTDTHKAYTETVTKTYFDENKGSAHSYAWDLVDKAGVEAGLEKPAGLKTSDWFRTVAKDNLDLRKKLEALKSSGDSESMQKKLDEMQSNYDKKHSDLQTQYHDEVEGYKSKVTLLETATVTNDRKSAITSIASKLTFNPAIGKDTMSEIYNMKVNLLAKHATEENGKTVWNKTDGTPYKNGMLNAELDHVINEIFGSMVFESNGGGGSNQTGISSSVQGDILLIDETKVKTGVDFIKVFDQACKDHGIEYRSEKYNTVFDATMKHYNISALKES